MPFKTATAAARSAQQPSNEALSIIEESMAEVYLLARWQGGRVARHSKYFNAVQVVIRFLRDEAPEVCRNQNTQGILGSYDNTHVIFNTSNTYTSSLALCPILQQGKQKYICACFSCRLLCTSQKWCQIIVLTNTHVYEYKEPGINASFGNFLCSHSIELS